MRTNIVKHKKISVAAFVGITALLLSIALFFGGYSFSAKAVDITDGSIIDYTVTADISLTLDVNGKSTPSTSTERDREHALENNSAHLRTRRIPINALHDKGDSYRLSSSGVTELYNYSTSYFTVTAGESSDGAYSMVEIVAKKSTVCDDIANQIGRAYKDTCGSHGYCRQPGGVAVYRSSKDGICGRRAQ